MTDSRFESCILLIRQGGKNGLKEIYDEYGRFIYSVMLAAVRSPQDAEDLTSEFFLKLWDKLADSYKEGRGHKRWLTVSARNMAVDFLRKQGREILTLDGEEEEAQTPEPVSPDDTENTVIGGMTVKEALEKLNGAEREVVNLKLFGDMTFDDIALTLGKPAGTVRWRYRTAIAKLRKYIGEVRKDD